MNRKSLPLPWSSFHYSSRLFTFFLGLIFLQACQEAPFYEKIYDLPEGKWYIDSVMVFNFQVDDAQSSYDFQYELRNTLDYPYYNLYVKFYLEDNKGTILDEELQNISLMDSRTGKPFGSGLGDMFAHELSVPRLTKFKFPAPGEYRLRIKQYMRENPLPEIISFGVRISKSSP